MQRRPESFYIKHKAESCFLPHVKLKLLDTLFQSPVLYLNYWTTDTESDLPNTEVLEKSGSICLPFWLHSSWASGPWHWLLYIKNKMCIHVYKSTGPLSSVGHRMLAWYHNPLFLSFSLFLSTSVTHTHSISLSPSISGCEAVQVKACSCRPPEAGWLLDLVPAAQGRGEEQGRQGETQREDPQYDSALHAFIHNISPHTPRS